MKKFQIRRHTDKNGEQASQKGLDRFATETNLVTNPDTVTDVFCGSILGRTAQTALAACCTHGIKAKVHEPDERFGSADLFGAWKEIGLVDAAKEHGSLLAGVKAILHPDKYLDARDTCVNVVVDCLEKIENDGHGLTYIHSPIVEMIAEGLGFDMEGVQLDSCEGIMLEQDEDGNVGVVAILKAS